MKVLYALHDAMVKPMPGDAMAPYARRVVVRGQGRPELRVVLRKGVVFHNSDPLTAEDMKFAFERYQGAAAKLLDRVAAVEIVDAHRVRFRLKEPWPDFLTFYASSAAGAGSIVPKKSSRRSATRASRGRRSAPDRTARRSTPASSWCSRPTTATGARLPHQAPGVEGRARGRDRLRHVRARRGRHHLLALRAPWANEVKRTAGLKLVPPCISASPVARLRAAADRTESRPGTTGACGLPPRLP